MPLSSASRPTFFMKRSDRLIARLQHLFHGMRFAKQVDGQMIMVWTPLPTFFHQFDTSEYHIDRIFDIREFYANGGYKDLIFFHSVAPFPKGLKSLQDPEYEAARKVGFSRDELSKPDFLGYSGIYVNFKFEDEKKSTSAVSEEVRSIFRSIPLEPTVQRILDFARGMIKTETYTALHVRQGDVGQMIRRDLPELAKGNLDSKQLALTIGHYLGRTAPYSFYYGEIQRAIEKGSTILSNTQLNEEDVHKKKNYVLLMSRLYRLGIGDGISVSVQRFPDLSFQALINPEGNIVVPLLGKVSLQGLTLEEAQEKIRLGLNRYVVDPVIVLALAVQRQDLSFQAAISPEGTIVVPQVGTVSLQGLTLEEAQEKIRLSLSRILPDPIVVVSLAGARPVQVTISGEIFRPGIYPISSPTPRVADALLVSGGSTLNADLRQIQVRRKLIDGSVISQTIDLYAALQNGGSIPNFRLQDGDAILIPVVKLVMMMVMTAI